MEKFLYSVIIPHYNCANLLHRLLESIPKRDDIQIIIIDDCSSSEQQLLLKKINRKNVFLVINDIKTNAGCSRNKGISIAKGKWILFADSDDFYHTDAFEVLDYYKNSNFDYMCFLTDSFDNEKNTVGGRNITSDRSVRQYLKKKNLYTENLFKYMNFACWNKMYSRDFLIKNNIAFENVSVCEDVFFSFQTSLLAKKFETISNVLYCCTYTPGSMTYQKRSIEREFLFYLQAKKRNGFFKKLGLGYPFYRYDFIYLPYMIMKRGLIEAIDFYRYCWTHRCELKSARNAYLNIFNYAK